MRIARSFLALPLLAAAAGCGDSGRDRGPSGDELSGTVTSDGSSTVFPVAAALAEEFQIEHPGVQVTVGISGTGGGFQRFCGGETDISNASRPISDGERERCEANGVEWSELPVASDGLSVVVNPENDFVRCLTVDELRRIWEPGSAVRTWRDVRSEWPAQGIRLYGPGTDSGTFDYFTEEVVGESGASRADYQASEDDNILVQGVAGDRSALGYFGFAYVRENPDRLKIVAVDGGNGCVEPTEETIESGEYAPLSRPLYIYAAHSAARRPEVEAYLRFMMENAAELVPATGYVPLSEERYGENLETLAEIGGGDAAPAGDGPATEPAGESRDEPPGDRSDDSAGERADEPDDEPHVHADDPREPGAASG